MQIFRKNEIYYDINYSPLHALQMVVVKLTFNELLLLLLTFYYIPNITVAHLYHKSSIICKRPGKNNLFSDRNVYESRYLHVH